MEALYLKKFGSPQDAFEKATIQLGDPSEGEIQIEVESFGLNFADVMARKGLYPDCPPLPAVIGYEVIGRIVAIGERVDNLQIGQRVIAMSRFGGYSTHVNTPAIAAVPVKEELPAGDALALVTQACTAWYMAEELVKLRTGMRVLIHAAAGGVGSLLVQICKNRGCEVFGTASPSKHQLLTSIGVDHPINYREKDYFSKIQEILGDHKLDVIFDPIGGKSLKEGIEMLGPIGKMICFGASTFTEAKGFIPKLRRFLAFGFYHPMKLMRNSQSLLSANMLRLGDYQPDYLNEILHKVVEAYEKEEIKPIASTAFPATQLSHAHELLESRKSTGKIVVNWE
ncbi:MAG: zinc-binding dehydrogenase [Bacteroidia bacterium]|nr:zinc-binding dehydrogenase [Bacteroidia bacterium]